MHWESTASSPDKSPLEKVSAIIVNLTGYNYIIVAVKRMVVGEIEIIVVLEYIIIVFTPPRNSYMYIHAKRVLASCAMGRVFICIHLDLRSTCVHMQLRSACQWLVYA